MLSGPKEPLTPGLVCVLIHIWLDGEQARSYEIVALAYTVHMSTPSGWGLTVESPNSAFFHPQSNKQVTGSSKVPGAVPLKGASLHLP